MPWSFGLPGNLDYQREMIEVIAYFNALNMMYPSILVVICHNKMYESMPLIKSISQLVLAIHT